MAVAPGSPGVVYSSLYSQASGWSLWKSLDGGAHWEPLDTGAASFFTTLAIAPSSPATLYLAEQVIQNSPSTGPCCFLAVSHDGGTSFQRHSSQLSFQVLAVDPADPNTLYASSDGEGLFKSTDGGLSFVKALRTGGGALAIDPAHPSVVYTNDAGDVMISRDGGSTWSQLGPGLAEVGGVGQIVVGLGGDVYALAGSDLFRFAP